MSNRTEILCAVRQFAQVCRYEKKHSEETARLAERLFDLLEPVHGISAGEKWLLTAGALLHDIGWAEGQSKHHKRSMEMILSDKTMPLEIQDRRLIALIARYHRKALPQDSHPIYNQLSADQRKLVNVLGGILRLADGLDRSHTCAVEGLSVEIDQDRIAIFCRGRQSVSDGVLYGQKKSDLLEQVLHKKFCVIECEKRS
jgi:exopolyphosphatase/guanosine-5'-triphosphate,3'-diphosphate pyrophosphatase